MSAFLEELWLNFRWADALDIGVVAIAIYFSLSWLLQRSTRSIAAIAIGLGLLYVLSRLLRMYLTLEVFHASLALLLFSLVVVFQQDLRYAFERLAAWRPFRKGTDTTPGEQFQQTLADAVRQLAEHRIGALLVLPGRQPLERHLRGGVLVDAHVSVPLLLSIFDAKSPGHDGAVVLHNERIQRLAVHLPLSSNREALGGHGTRHAAALGLADRSDALVIVVSEETGAIALAYFGQLERLSSAAELTNRLGKFYSQEPSQPTPPARHKTWAKRSAFQLLAVALASMLWLVFAYRVEQIQRTVTDVPVEFRKVPDNWNVDLVDPQSLEVTLVGPERAFERFREEDVKLSLDLRYPVDGEQEITLSPSHVSVPDGLQVRNLSVNRIYLRAYRTRTVRLPVEVQTIGKLPPRMEIDRITVGPEQLQVRVAVQGANQTTSIPTEPIDLSTLQELINTRNVSLRVPRRAQLAPDQPSSVWVTIRLRRVENSSDAQKKEGQDAP